jgi:hypothetical protein
MIPRCGSDWSAWSWALPRCAARPQGSDPRQARPRRDRPRYGFVRGDRANECIAKGAKRLWPKIDREIERSISNRQRSSAQQPQKRGGMYAPLFADRANRDDRLRRSHQESVRGWRMRGGRSTRVVLLRGYAIERSTGFWAESGSSRRLEMVVQHQGSLILTSTDVTGADGNP